MIPIVEDSKAGITDLQWKKSVWALGLVRERRARGFSGMLLILLLDLGTGYTGVLTLGGHGATLLITPALL